MNERNRNLTDREGQTGQATNRSVANESPRRNEPVGLLQMMLESPKTSFEVYAEYNAKKMAANTSSAATNALDSSNSSQQPSSSSAIMPIASSCSSNPSGVRPHTHGPHSATHGAAVEVHSASSVRDAGAGNCYPGGPESVHFTHSSHLSSSSHHTLAGHAALGAHSAASTSHPSTATGPNNARLFSDGIPLIHKYVCSFCLSSSQYEINIREHLVSCQKHREAEAPIRFALFRMSYVCFCCKAEDFSFEQLISHFISHHSGIICELCNVVFFPGDSYTEHRVSHNTSGPTLMRTGREEFTLGRLFTSGVNLGNPASSVDQEEPNVASARYGIPIVERYTCNHCHVKTAYWFNISNHVRSCKKPHILACRGTGACFVFNFVCFYCKEGRFNFQQLLRHFQVSHSALKCDVCQVMFLPGEKYNYHKASHKKKLRYYCTICFYYTQTYNDTRSHVASHPGVALLEEQISEIHHCNCGEMFMKLDRSYIDHVCHEW